MQGWLYKVGEGIPVRQMVVWFIVIGSPGGKASTQFVENLEIQTCRPHLFYLYKYSLIIVQNLQNFNLK